MYASSVEVNTKPKKGGAVTYATSTLLNFERGMLKPILENTQ